MAGGWILRSGGGEGEGSSDPPPLPPRAQASARMPPRFRAQLDKAPSLDPTARSLTPPNVHPRPPAMADGAGQMRPAEPRMLYAPGALGVRGAVASPLTKAGAGSLARGVTPPLPCYGGGVRDPPGRRCRPSSELAATAGPAAIDDDADGAAPTPSSSSSPSPLPPTTTHHPTPAHPLSSPARPPSSLLGRLVSSSSALGGCLVCG
jgi:hypothetical protein